MFIYYLKNCGLYFTTNTDGILVDGLFEKYKNFDGLSDKMIQEILSKNPPFDTLHATLFTHNHPDHYNKELLEQCPFTRSDDFYKLSSFEIAHLPSPADKTTHYVFFLTIEQTTIFISGDANPVQCYRRLSKLDLPKVDYTFVNPFFLKVKPGKQFLNLLNAKQNFIYHLPTNPDDDIFGYYEMIQKNQHKVYHVTPLINFSKKPLLIVPSALTSD